MQLSLNRFRRASCPDALLPVDQLTDEQLLIRKAKTRQMSGVVVMLMLLMVVMAFVLEAYMVAACTSAMIPALDDYEKKRKAIVNELRKRNLR
ncbi:hypothetical protein [Spirosoma linguale]|uniref:Uncharacterized protein n=1 Tax=Spirosoma linguale (strain ATCC 33905 / DSM 74 / LMG 10896 / Claus 1) TaxID=504472 RepID=D2QBG2_SPILD|nr:hypothetical protein Slin_0071 [Spirosoma linguale DSM 74]